MVVPINNYQLEYELVHSKLFTQSYYCFLNNYVEEIHVVLEFSPNPVILY